MTAIYRIPLATELAYLEKKVAADDAEMLMRLVRACYALALGPGPSEAEVGPFMPSLTHPDPAVWGPAFVYVRQLLPRFPGLRAAVHGLLDHPDPAVRLRLLHWQEWPSSEADDLDTDGGQEAMLQRLLRDEVAEVRFDTVLLMHQMAGGANETRWWKGQMREALPEEGCPEVRALITAVLAFGNEQSAAAVGPSRLMRVSLDRMEGGQMPGAWLSLDLEPEALLVGCLGKPPIHKCSYDRLPGQGHHAAWCAWRDQIRWIIRAALAAEAESESALDDAVAVHTLTNGWTRIEQRDYRQAYCPACGVVYEAAQMLQPAWRDGREPLAMVGGFEIFCPARHLLFNRMTWRS
jgi:hypothetical protein